MNRPHENMSEDLLARYLAGSLSPEEKQIVDNWLAESPQNERELADYKLIWDHAGSSTRNFAVDTDLAWGKVKKQMSGGGEVPLNSIEAKPARRSAFSWWIAAASVLLLIAFGWVYVSKTPNTEMITVATANNMQEKVLPDGSKVFLNYNSSISYPAKFTADSRAVTLTGEAFFDIEKDAARPFTIDANGTQVKVLGTSFNVKAYEGKSVRVDVTSGKVRVSKASREVHLTKGQSAEVSADTIRSLAANANVMSYRTQVYDFNATDLQEVVSSIRDGYHVDVRLGNGKIAKCRLTIKFEKEPVDATLAVIAETLDLDLRKEGQTYWLDGDGCDQ